VGDRLNPARPELPDFAPPCQAASRVVTARGPRHPCGRRVRICGCLGGDVLATGARRSNAHGTAVVTL
jgi:hypothetical protein